MNHGAPARHGRNRTFRIPDFAVPCRSQGEGHTASSIPVCSEMWPGNTTDVTTLDQVAGRLQSRFGVRRVCLVAESGMISKKMIAAVEARGWFYILGARLRRTKEVRDVVLSDTGAFDTVEVARPRALLQT